MLRVLIKIAQWCKNKQKVVTLVKTYLVQNLFYEDLIDVNLNKNLRLSLEKEASFVFQIIILQVLPEESRVYSGFLIKFLKNDDRGSFICPRF